VLAASTTIAACGGGAGQANRPSGPLAATPTVATGPASQTSARGRYGIVARMLSFGGVSGDPWDVPVEVKLIAPSGRISRIGAFHYSPGVWEFRFSPPERGRWRWRATLTDGSVGRTRAGSFTTQRRQTPGFVHLSAANPYLWSFENGAPYYPLGIETCLIDPQHIGTPFALVLDGGLRPNGGKVAPGQKQDLQGAGGMRVGLDQYIGTYARAGFNLYRWSVGNCAFGLYRSISPGGNVYDAADGRLGDELVGTLHKYGMRVYMTFFSHPPGVGVGDAPEMTALERYVKYVVDRYGAYVDFWELMNEDSNGSAWYQQITSYLRSVDPYHHPISTSNPPSNLSALGLDIYSPHWYETENELDSDSNTFNRFRAWKADGKPVIVGEQGNAGHNWDSGSGVRMRLRIWTAFFSQGTIVFWNEVAFKDLVAGAGDIWLGPSERLYAAVLSGFTSGFDPRARIARPSISQPGRVRGYELNGPRDLALYLTAYTNHSSLNSGIEVGVDPTFAGTATWIDPATGAVLARQKLRRGESRLRVPAFRTDIALKIKAVR
jgi:hypothetical protein